MTAPWHALRDIVLDPVAQTPWNAGLGFWLGQILDDRYVVVWCLPLVPVLLLLPRQKLRLGIVLTGAVFVAYVFGGLYLLFWFGSCVVLHRLAERFAVECRRTDVWRGGPPLVMGLLVGGWYLGTLLLHDAMLPGALNAWLYEHARWIFPLGVRAAWEPDFRKLMDLPASGSVPLLGALFWNVHNIGTAYLAVRMLQYLAGIRRGNLSAERRTLLNFLAWTCYAPTLMQGPLERFAVFQDELDTCHERRGWHNVPPACGRIGLGILKSLIVTWYLLPLLRDELGIGADQTYYRQPERIGSFWLLYTGVFWHIFALYLEFSGYCDVSAGVARLLGYRQIENFNRPWAATSLRDFWHRWHISLSFILRDYVYIALGGNRRHVTLNLCVTFFVVGIWHGLLLQVGVWGIVMGLMVAVNQRWVGWMKQLDGRPDSPLGRVRRGWLWLRPLPTLCAWLLTQHAFVFSLLIFFGGEAAIRVPVEIARRVLAAWP